MKIQKSKMSRFLRIAIITIILATAYTGHANGLCVENVQLNRNNNKLIVSFDLSWNNSWNNKHTKNHDGVWIFAKYRLDDGDWMPIYFDEFGHTIREKNFPTRSQFELGYSNARDYSGENITREIVGLFIYHTIDTTGYTANFENTQLVFDIEKHGIIDENVVAIRVFGIEMVYVPTSEFDIGDNASAHRFVKHDSVLYLTNNNTFDWHDSIPTPFSPEKSLFPVANVVDNVAGIMVPGIGRITATASLDVVDPSRGPWAPFGMQALGNNKEDSAFWITSHSLSTDWQWIEFQFDNNTRKRGEYVVVKARTGENARPRGFVITGSNDGENYEVIGGYKNHTKIGTSIFGVTPNAWGVYLPFRITKPGEYNRYRFYFYSFTVALPFIGLYDDYLNVNKITNESKLYFMSRETEIPEEFPKGFNNFWVMKYEVTQLDWTEFLNTLTFDQQLNRTGLARGLAATTRLGTGRNWIRVQSVDSKTGRYTFGLNIDGTLTGNWAPSENAGQVPVFNLNWADAAAYADWAGLRPLTELEFEKMSRGFIEAVPNEFAWGSSMISPISSEVGLLNINRVNEVQERGLPGRRIAAGNVRTSPNGQPTHQHWPMRVGAFAATNVSSRMESGSTFFGIMNTSDNVAERYINVSTPQGRTFTGEHGDGKLNASGFANVPNWPGEDSKGTGYRGFYNNINLPVSNRQYMDVENAARNMWDGFRGGRTSTR
jgi:hypothetical protein